ncbi:acyl-CoA reductase [Mucilaginibacter auburnensis]|uniref:Acyl-CoA reductase LuxC n=1 Tax=Mucilaginibacter auburnensis TaxID=1457233 RepID=A0A2H9VLX4_9SPHI|nr:acyl-CoA reductase [Mucilaginibacter auburnensis]PJJ79338.1 acyl-CoA reductase LuxC [Mucilaginibacter auburnensis]
MSKISSEQLIHILSELGASLQQPDEQLQVLIQQEQYHNAWFTPANVERAIVAIGETLNQQALQKWLSAYNLDKEVEEKKVGLILAGNIPLVGFHDVLCVLISGHHALIKASTQDARLIRQVLNILATIEPSFADKYTFVEQLKDFDAVIATGSDNSSRYFEYYFGKVPHIIRKNRNSIAVITGDETTEELNLLGEDIFSYFGLGCRNVSKLSLPAGYDIGTFFRPIETYQPIINHHKYNNNYDYNKSIYLVNNEKHFDNGFVLLREHEALASPLAVVHYEYYSDLAEAEATINAGSEKIQCVVCISPLKVNSQVVAPGQSQTPQLWDYADGVDTLDFLIKL